MNQNNVVGQTGPKTLALCHVATKKVARGRWHLAAYTYAGQCINAFVWAIRGSLPDPLNAQEVSWFQRVYESQPCFGGLPLALLEERLQELKHALQAIWGEPGNEEHVQVLHRLLDYYTNMAPERRRADRRSKRVCSATRAGTGRPPDNHDEPAGRSGAGDEIDASEAEHASARNSAADSQVRGAIHTEFIDGFHATGSQPSSHFSELAEDLRELAGVECDRCARWAHEVELNDHRVTFTFCCECGKVAESVPMPLRDVIARGRKLFGVEWDILTRSA